MERVSVAINLFFLFLRIFPGNECQILQNAKDSESKNRFGGSDHSMESITRLQHQNEFQSDIGYSFTNHLVRRYRYQGPMLGKREKLDVQKQIVGEFINAHRGRGGIVGELGSHISTKSTDKKALPYQMGQGWQLDDALINKHFELLNDQSILEECAQRQWTHWSAWSVCSAHCGYASRFQYRDCVFMGRMEGKKDCGYLSFKSCKGKDMKRMECEHLPPCTEITTWGVWSDCSAMCQSEVGVRKRVMLKESSRGTKTKIPEMTQEESCKGSRHDCTGWSQWSRCSESCSNQVGIRERTLVITTPEGFHKRDVSRLEMEPCVGQRMLCEAWTSWSVWTSCDCRRRQRRRERTCERRFIFTSSAIGIKVDDSMCRGRARMSVPCAPDNGACKVRSRGRKSKKRKPFLSSLKTRPRRLRSRRRVPGCKIGCQGLPFGRYPSCRSCFHYWQCYSRSQKERMCAKRRRWDNQAKKCLPWSSTCPGV